MSVNSEVSPKSGEPYYRLSSGIMCDPVSVHDNQKSRDNRRGADRKQYSHWQYVASKPTSSMPEWEDYNKVRFKDISGSGFSYISRHTPNSDHVVAMLGSEDHSVFVLAKVVRIIELSNDEPITHLIGCRIVRRIE